VNPWSFFLGVLRHQMISVLQDTVLNHFCLCLKWIDVDLKKAAKLFANKFACGSSVTKNNQGNDEIVVQGDVSDEIFDLILEHWPVVRMHRCDVLCCCVWSFVTRILTRRLFLL